MGSKYFKTRRKPKSKLSRRFKFISVQGQLKRLKKSFPDLLIEEDQIDRFSVVVQVQPDPLSKEYDLRIVYEQGKVVEVFVVNEKLKIANNRVKLPHVFDNDRQKICLYSKDGGRWDQKYSIVSTIVPWASEWLFHYESWLIDGEWRGGGHDEYANVNEVKNEEEIQNISD